MVFEADFPLMIIPKFGSAAKAAHRFKRTHSVPQSVEVVVVGAGIVGLAVARQLARSGREVVIVEREPKFGTGISGRGSAVIHAGIYYPKDSLKTRLCVAGRTMLYDYCKTRHIGHQRCGKLIIASSDGESQRLDHIWAKARRAGVADIVDLDPGALHEIEPALAAERALFSPSTGIVDPHALMLSLLGEAEDAGATIAYNSKVASFTAEPIGVTINFVDPALPPISAHHVVNAAGLDATGLATTVGPAPRSLYAKGNYFALKGVSPFTHLIYPLPEPGGLGIHLTLDLAGRARFGPDVEWVDTPSFDVAPERAPQFYRAIRRYWPGLAEGELVPAYAGVRPKLEGSTGDFMIHRAACVTSLLGIESPGLTASLALAQHVRELLTSE